MEDIPQLQEQVRRLKEKVRNYEADLELAGHAGNQLLELNNELQLQQEGLHKDYTKKIEALEQEKYNQQLKLEAVRGQLEAQVTDLDMQRRDDVSRERQLREQLQTEHAQKVKTLTDQIRDLKTSQEEAAMLEQQLRDKVEQQEQLLCEAQSQRRDPNMSVSLGEDSMTLQLELDQLRTDKTNLGLQLRDSEDIVQQLRFSLDKQQETSAALRHELEETERKATGYYNALEKSREDILGLEAQIEALKLQSVDPNSRGNSLFAEVEDRRVAVEKKMISMQVQHESLKKQHMATKQQLQKLKAQFAALLQMGGGRADASQVQRLEQALSQSRAETQVLSNKLKATERQLEMVENNPRKAFEQYQSNFSELGGRKDYAAFLEDRLKESKEETKKVKSQLDQQKFLQMADKDRLLHCERKLYEAESKAESLHGQNMKLLVQLEDMKLKYQPELLDSTKVRIGRLEKIPLGKKKTAATTSASSDMGTAGKTAGDIVGGALKNSTHKAAKTTGNDSTTESSTDTAANQAPNSMVENDNKQGTDISITGKKGNGLGNPDSAMPCKGDRGSCSNGAAKENAQTNSDSQSSLSSDNVSTKNAQLGQQVEIKEELNMETDEFVSSRKVRFDAPIQPGGRLSIIGRRDCDSDDDDDYDEGTRRVRRPIGRGRKSHKVVHVPSDGRPECKQQ
ncbi:protein Spindly-A-like [Branchiostoma lanceolatum]|uniref:protein Spindly-A-like n=1 Tax=Branchiostoma lanceolatum TaxID=7740 RepID=UPI0034550193